MSVYYDWIGHRGVGDAQSAISTRCYGSHNVNGDWEWIGLINCSTRSGKLTQRQRRSGFIQYVVRYLVSYRPSYAGLADIQSRTYHTRSRKCNNDCNGWRIPSSLWFDAVCGVICLCCEAIHAVPGGACPPCALGDSSSQGSNRSVVETV